MNSSCLGKRSNVSEGIRAGQHQRRRLDGEVKVNTDEVVDGTAGGGRLVLQNKVPKLFFNYQRKNAMSVELALQDCQPQPQPFHVKVTLLYDSGKQAPSKCTKAFKKGGNIMHLLNVFGQRNTDDGGAIVEMKDGKCTVKIAIREVSKVHQNQKFTLRFQPLVDGMTGVQTAPILVKSKKPSTRTSPVVVSSESKERLSIAQAGLELGLHEFRRSCGDYITDESKYQNVINMFAKFNTCMQAVCEIAPQNDALRVLQQRMGEFQGLLQNPVFSMDSFSFPLSLSRGNSAESDSHCWPDLGDLLGNLDESY